MRRLFYLYMVAVPSLAIVGLINLSGAPKANVALLFSNTALNWVMGLALFIGTLTYLALATELMRPPQSSLRTLVVILDTPLLVLLGSLEQGAPQLDLLGYDGLIEAVAAVLALIPIQFSGSIRVKAKTGSDILWAMVLILLLGAGPGVVLGAMVAGLAMEGAWVGVASVLIAVAWSTYTYYRLVRYAKSDTENWGWILIALAIMAATGITCAIIAANT